MNHRAPTVGLLSAVALTGFMACKTSTTKDGSTSTEAASLATSAGTTTSVGGATGTSATSGASGSAGASGAPAEASCPIYDPEVTHERAPSLIHAPDVYEIFVFGVVEGLAYFVEGSELRRIPVEGGDPETLGPIYPSWVRMVGTERVLWVQPNSNADALQIVSAPLDDPSDVSVIVEETPSVSYLVLDDSAVYWATTDPHEVFRAPLSGGGPELLVSEAQPLGAVIHDEHYYWLDYSSDHLERIPVGGGTREELTPIFLGGPMAAADGAIYWGDTSLSTIEKWSFDDGPVRLARAIDPMQIQVIDDIVYWSQGLLGGKVRAIGVDGTNEQDVLCNIRSRPSIVVTDDHVLVGGGSGLIRVAR